MDPWCTLPTYLSQTHFNIILPSTPTSSRRSLPFRFSDCNFIFNSHPSHASYVPRPPVPCQLRSTPIRPMPPTFHAHLTLFEMKTQIVLYLVKGSTIYEVPLYAIFSLFCHIPSLPPPSYVSHVGPNYLLSTLFKHRHSVCKQITFMWGVKKHIGVLIRKQAAATEDFDMSYL